MCIYIYIYIYMVWQEPISAGLGLIGLFYSRPPKCRVLIFLGNRQNSPTSPTSSSLSCLLSTLCSLLSSLRSPLPSPLYPLTSILFPLSSLLWGTAVVLDWSLVGQNSALNCCWLVVEAWLCLAFPPPPTPPRTPAFWAGVMSSIIWICMFLGRQRGDIAVGTDFCCCYLLYPISKNKQKTINNRLPVRKPFAGEKACLPVKSLFAGGFLK